MSGTLDMPSATFGMITARIIAADRVELVRKGQVGRHRPARHDIWGVRDIQVAYATVCAGKAKDREDQERALRWAMERLRILPMEGWGRR